MTKKTLEELEAERFLWSLKTFPETTTDAGLLKAIDEIHEVFAAVRDGKPKDDIAEECVDVIMCILDSAARAGIYIGDIRDAFERKLAINKGRKWVLNERDKTYSHVKEVVGG